jgi:hypothetical protein
MTELSGARLSGEKTKTAITDQFGQIYGTHPQFDGRLVKYSPAKGYVKFEFEDRIEDATGTSEAFVLSKTPRIVVERNLIFVKSGEEISIFDEDSLSYTTNNTRASLDFGYFDLDGDNFAPKNLPKDTIIMYTIPDSSDYYGGPYFARIDLNKNFKPEFITLPFLDKNGLLASMGEENIKMGASHAQTNPAAYLDLKKGDMVAISIMNQGKLREKGVFPKGEMFKLPDTNHGYKVTHENDEWTFSQYDLTDNKNPRLVKQVGTRDLDVNDINASLKGNLKAWSSLPERILTPIVNN